MSALGSIDVEKNKLRIKKLNSKVDVGFSGDRILKELKFKKLISD